MAHIDLTPTGYERVFDSTEARDAYLQQHYPDRIGLDCPGEYVNPDGSMLSVAFEVVAFTKPSEEGRRALLGVKVEEALAAASDKFWEVIAKSFPHIESGDLDPDTEMDFHYAMQSAVFQWITLNERGE